MIGQCQNGPRRRADLLTYRRPAIRRFMRAARFVGFWFASIVAVALVVALILMLIAEGMRDPLTTMKPTVGNACFKSAPRSV